MREMIGWIAASGRAFTTEDTEEHRGTQSPQSVADNADNTTEMGQPSLNDCSRSEMSWEEERERRIYRRRTVQMLRRYMRYSMETGRMPSLLGREFFRAKVTAYIVVTFEDRVIFVHDMETCLSKLDEFSRELIAKHILQEHDQEATARLLHCTSRTVRTYVPLALDLLSEILLDMGLLERLFPIRKNVVKGGKSTKSL